VTGLLAVMSNDDDVIEIGEDGSFDITTPPKKATSATPPSASATSSQKKVDPLLTTTIPPEEILNLVPVGEYKVFSAPNSKETFLIIHLYEAEEPKQVRVVEHELMIDLKSHSLSVDLKNLHIDESSIHTTSWQDFLTFRFFKVTQ
jgi:hypothetical protein